MRYLLLIYQPADAPDPTPMEAQESLEGYAAFTRETQRRNVLQAGEALEPVTSATTVRVREGRTLVTDGPFAETKEFLGGFYLLDCRDLDEAIELAGQIPGAAYGSIEIRPIWELPMQYAADGAAVAG